MVADVYIIPNPPPQNLTRVDEDSVSSFPIMMDTSVAVMEQDSLAFNQQQSLAKDEKSSPDLEENLDHNLFEWSNEQTQLEEAFNTLTQTAPITGKKKNFVLVSGEVGSGKTTVANSLKTFVDKDGGYFVTGSFNKMTVQPYYAFEMAVTDFTNQVIARGQVEEMNKVLQAAVKSQLSVLTSSFPALEEIVGDQLHADQNGLSSGSATATLPSSDAWTRFTYTFRLFLNAVASLGPLVIFLDDLQHAEGCQLNLLANLVCNVDSNKVMFLCTCLGNLDTTHPVCEMLREIEQTLYFPITNIAISNLCIGSISEMVSKLLDVPKERSAELAKAILKKTSGNALFVVEYIRRLHSHGLIYYDSSLRQWTWDDEDIRRMNDFTCVQSLLSSKLQDIPPQLKELLKVASCLGGNLEEQVLAQAMSATDVSTYIAMALERNLLVKAKRSKGLVFSNGSVQEAFYRLIDEDKRPEFHLGIGRNLVRNCTVEEMDKHIFLVLNQLRHGSHLLSSQEEKHTVAELCLHAGKKSIHASGFKPASACFTNGTGLLCRNSWKDRYELVLDLYSSNAEMFYVLSEFNKAFEMIQIILDCTRNFRDQLRAWNVRILILGAQDRRLDAIKDGLFVLSELGESFPKNPRLGLSLWLEYRFLNHKLCSMSNERILRLPSMRDPDKLATMQVLNLLFLTAFLAQTNLYPYMALRMVQLSLSDGLCAISSFGFAMFGMMVCGISNDVTKGFRFGDLALEILDKCQAKQWIPRVYVIAFGCLGPWKISISKTLEPLLKASQIGQESGDVEFSLLAANMYLFNSYDSGRQLTDIESDITAFTKICEEQKHELAMLLISTFGETIRSLIGTVDYSQILKKHQSRCAHDDRVDFCLGIVSYERALVAFAFNDLERAEVAALECYKLFKNLPLASFEVCQVQFMVAVISVTIVRRKAYQVARKSAHLKIVRKTIKNQRRWVKVNPAACYGKLFLLEAEMAARKGDFTTAQGKYTCALALTKSEGILSEHATVGVFAGRFMHEHGKLCLSKDFFRGAHETYVTWGAKARAAFLCQEIELLFPVRRS